MKKILLIYRDDDDEQRHQILEVPDGISIKDVVLNWCNQYNILSFRPIEAYTITEQHDFFGKGWKDIETVKTNTL